MSTYRVRISRQEAGDLELDVVAASPDHLHALIEAAYPGSQILFTKEIAVHATPAPVIPPEPESVSEVL
jgi:hypothetical protein